MLNIKFLILLTMRKPFWEINRIQVTTPQTMHARALRRRTSARFMAFADLHKNRLE
jgi:hypothetical protein